MFVGVLLGFGDGLTEGDIEACVLGSKLGLILGYVDGFAL